MIASIISFPFSMRSFGILTRFRLNLRGSQGRLQFFAIRRRPEHLYPAVSTSTQVSNHPSADIQLLSRESSTSDQFQQQNTTESLSILSPLAALRAPNTTEGSTTTTVFPLDAHHQDSIVVTAFTNPNTNLSTLGGVGVPSDSFQTFNRIRSSSKRRRTFEPALRRRRFYDEDDYYSINSDDNNNDNNELGIDAIFVRSPTLRLNRSLQKRKQWHCCGNVLLGQHSTSNQTSHDGYFYEIWTLGQFHNIPNSMTDHCLCNNCTPSVDETVQQSWRPFIDMRDLNDSITLLPYQHDLAPFLNAL